MLVIAVLAKAKPPISLVFLDNLTLSKFLQFLNAPPAI